MAIVLLCEIMGYLVSYKGSKGSKGSQDFRMRG